MSPDFPFQFHVLLVLLSPFLAVSQTGSSQPPCYYPNGTYAADDVPCHTTQPTFCCGQGHSCMSNGLCRWGDEYMIAPLAYVRGSCTDKSWASSNCPPHCANVMPASWDKIIECPSNKSEYCCSPYNFDSIACCSPDSAFASLPSNSDDASATVFRLGSATTVTVIGVPLSAVSMASTVSHTADATIYSSATSDTSTVSTTAAQGKNMGGGGGGGEEKIGIGVGIGVGLVVLLLALGFGIFWGRRRRKSRRGQHHTAVREVVGDGNSNFVVPETGVSELYGSESGKWSRWKDKTLGRPELDGRASGKRAELPA